MKSFQALFLATTLVLSAAPVLAQETAAPADYMTVPSSDEAPVTPEVLEAQVQATQEVTQTQETQPEVQPAAVSPAIVTTETAPASLSPDAVQINRQEVPLQHYSAKKYKAVQFTVKNVLAAPVELLMGEVTGAIDEEALAEEKEVSRQRKRGALGRGLGLATAVPGFMGIGGVAGVVTANAVRGVYGASNMAASIADSRRNDEVSTYISRFQNVRLSPDGVYTFTAVVPKNQTPALRMVVRDLQRNQVVDVVSE